MVRLNKNKTEQINDHANMYKKAGFNKTFDNFNEDRRLITMVHDPTNFMNDISIEIKACYYQVLKEFLNYS
jgi:hypothetical protein